jgi:ribosomal protein S18 acetylase RimI-like enzyme
MIEDELVGAVILNEEQSNEWKQIKWTEINGSALVIHAMVINPKHQNKGFGKKLLVYCEEYAKENRYACLRLDSFTKNPISNKLYQKFGYKKVGVVEFNMKPEGNMEYYCYEKIL